MGGRLRNTAEPADRQSAVGRLAPCAWLLGLASLIAPAAATGSTLPPTLQATVGSGSISLKTSSGRALMKLRAGVYVVVVHDKSRRQTFHLRGGKIDRTTTAAFVGTVRWRLRLTRGHYVFRSDRQDSLQGDFTVR